MIAGAHQRTGLNVAEAEAQRSLPQLAELLRRVEARNRQVIARRTQILTHGKNVDAAATEIAKHLDQLFRGFAQPNHHAALGDYAGRKLFGIFEQVESALVARAGAHGTIESR